MVGNLAAERIIYGILTLSTVWQIYPFYLYIKYRHFMPLRSHPTLFVAIFLATLNCLGLSTGIARIFADKITCGVYVFFMALSCFSSSVAMTILFAYLYFSNVVKKKISEELLNVRTGMAARSHDLHRLNWFIEHRSLFRADNMIKYFFVILAAVILILGCSIFVGFPEFSSRIISESGNCATGWVTPYMITIMCVMITNPPAVYILIQWIPIPDSVHIKSSTNAAFMSSLPGLLLIFVGLIPAVNTYMSQYINWIDAGYLWAQHTVFFCFVVLPLRHVNMKREPGKMNSASSAEAHNQKFDKFLEDEDNVMAFREFLLKQHCVENLVFYMAVKRFRELPEEKQLGEAQLIMETFIVPYSPMEINLPGKASSALKEKLDEKHHLRSGHVVSRDMFDEAQSIIFSLMEYDSFRVYKNRMSSRNVSETSAPATPTVNSVVPAAGARQSLDVVSLSQ